MYQAFGLEGGGARRQASFLGCRGVAPPTRPCLCPSVPLLTGGTDGVTRFQQLLSGPGDVMWATRRDAEGGGRSKQVGAALPSPLPTPLGPSRPPSDAIYLMGVPLTHTLPGNPWAVASPLLHITFRFPHDWARPPVSSPPSRFQGFLFRSNVRDFLSFPSVWFFSLLPCFDVGGFPFGRKQTLSVGVGWHR